MLHGLVAIQPLACRGKLALRPQNTNLLDQPQVTNKNWHSIACLDVAAHAYPVLSRAPQRNLKGQCHQAGCNKMEHLWQTVGGREGGWQGGREGGREGGCAGFIRGNHIYCLSFDRSALYTVSPAVCPCFCPLCCLGDSAGCITHQEAATGGSLLMFRRAASGLGNPPTHPS